MLGPPKLRALDQPVTISLEALVPSDHFYRHLDARLDLGFVRDWVQGCYAGVGRPSIDPVVFFKLQLVMFFEGIRSERRLMETVALNLAHRWYLGYGLDEPLPDHSSLTRIRERLGVAIFQRFFEHVVDLCQRAGLIWGKELFFDATNVRANAAVGSLVPRWYQEAKAHLDEVFPADAPERETVAGGKQPRRVVASAGWAGRSSEPAVLPFAGTEAERARLAATNDSAWKLLEQRRLDPARPPTRNGYRRRSASAVSLTDPDATLIRKTGEATRLGYRDHYVVDGGKARIVLAALVTPADVMENTPMLDLLHRVRCRWRLRPCRAVGDTTYGTIDNIRALEDAGIRAYLPLRVFDDRSAYFSPFRFTYEPDADAYRCPQEHALRREAVSYTTETVRYRADPATCNRCPVKAACTPSTDGRTLHRSFHAAYLDRVRGYHATAAYQKAMRKRAVWVEPLFGEAKDWHGLRRFRLRGLWKVNCEGLLVATGQNLKRWLTRTGWGRRHGPGGSLAPSTRAAVACS